MKDRCVTELLRRRRLILLAADSRASQAQSTIELMAGLMILLPLFLAALDITIIIVANQVNDNACRDAARVAANGRPTADETTSRAELVLRRASQSSGYIHGPTLISVTPVDIKPPSANFGGSYQGNVRVETKVTVNLPVPIPGLLPAIQEFYASQEYPVTFIEPPAAAQPSLE
jgi:hypothetical protein